MSRDPDLSVEDRAIGVATGYAVKNGYADDPAAVGLFLAGMALASLLNEDTRREVASVYLASFPAHVRDPIKGWAAYIEGER